MKRFEGKVALVTGASRGIGAAIARRLGAEGAYVCVNYASSEDAAVSVVGDIIEAGGNAECYRWDVSDPEACRDHVAIIAKNRGSLDILVNNAGITRDGALMRMSDADWDDVIATNLTGSFNMMRAAARYMMKQRSGAIINISSVVGLVGNPFQANYTASKAGVIGLTKSVAQELASRGVRCNAVAPGFIETDMTSGLGDDVCGKIRDKIALGEFGQPEDISGAVAFLASDEASYITGQVLTVDGGMTFCG